MVAPSKLFHWPINCLHCSQLPLHPGKSCREFWYENMGKLGLASVKYFSPLLLTPILLKAKTLNRQILLDLLKYYLQTVVCTSIACTGTFSLICVLRVAFGKFRKYTTIFLPVYCGMQLCWWFPQRSMRLFFITTSQSTLEAMLRQNPNTLTRLMSESKLMQSLLFMLSGAVILHFKRVKQYNGFWFIQPHFPPKERAVERERQTRDREQRGSQAVINECVHKGMTCRKFVLKGMWSYLLYGMPLDLLNMITKSKVPRNTKGTLRVCLAKLKMLRFNMTGFFLSYVAIYRLSSCLLSKHFPTIPHDVQHFVAAFSGGLSYLCLNNANFYTLSLVMATQILWDQYCTNSPNTENPNSLLQLLKRVPFSRIIFPFNMAYLVHCYIFQNNAVNGLGKRLINGLAANIPQRIHDHLEKNTLEIIMTEANALVRKGFF